MKAIPVLLHLGTGELVVQDGFESFRRVAETDRADTLFRGSHQQKSQSAGRDGEFDSRPLPAVSVTGGCHTQL